MQTGPPNEREIAPTGVAGLDEILGGGLPRGFAYLIQGESGTGKTTLGLQFALAGLAEGETVLYVSLSESEREMEEIGRSHGWDLSGLHIHELGAARKIEGLEAEQTIFHTADIELDEATEEILQRIEAVRPDRAVFDSVTELRLLADSALRYRRQVLLLRQALIELDCTVLFMNNEPDRPDQPIYSLVRGIINLDRLPVDYGNERRRLRVAKVRGLAYRRGFHDYRIVTGGLVVYPRLRVAEAEQEPTWETISSGLPGLDELLGGGLVAGAACLIAGPSGVGKSSLATQYVYAAARRGERSAVFVFDEHRETFLRRAEGIGLDVRPFVREGLIQVRQIDAGEISPGEFTVLLQQIVTEDSLRLVVIDSMNGYLNAMPQERLLRIHLHELLTYLGQQGILSLLTTTYHGVIETTLQQEVEFSYLADAVLLLRHFETRGEVRQAITVIKKRHGPHERTVREIRLTGDGIEVGPPLIAFSGVMSGRLRYEGERGDLMGQGDGGAG